MSSAKWNVKFTLLFAVTTDWPIPTPIPPPMPTSMTPVEIPDEDPPPFNFTQITGKFASHFATASVYFSNPKRKVTRGTEEIKNQ